MNMGQNDQAAGYATYILEGLEHLDHGITIFDGELKLVAWNRKFLEMLGYPDALAVPGAPLERFIAYTAARGEYGPRRSGRAGGRAVGAGPPGRGASV